jgi:hypothetical protein
MSAADAPFVDAAVEEQVRVLVVFFGYARRREVAIVCMPREDRAVLPNKKHLCNPFRHYA